MTSEPTLLARIETLEASAEAAAICITDLRDCISVLTDSLCEAGEQLKALQLGATCPHIVSSDEGTSYCALAEATARIGQPDVPANTSAQANSKPTSSSSQIRSSLVKRVARAISLDSWDVDPASWTAEARAAIREVAEWLREHHADGDPVAATALEREARR